MFEGYIVDRAYILNSIHRSPKKIEINEPMVGLR